MGIFAYPETFIRFFLLGIFAVILAFIAMYFNKRKMRLFSILFLIILIASLSLFSGLRSINVGVDTQGYYDEFSRNYYSSRMYDEFVFYEISYFIRDFFDNVQFVFVFWAIIINAFIILRIWDFKNKISFPISILSFYVLWYFSTFSGIRQWICVAIIFYSTRFIFDRKNYIIYIVIILLCSTIHLSSVIGLLYLPISIWIKTKSNTTRYISLFFIIIVGGLFIVYYSNSHNFLDRYDYLLTQQQSFSFGFKVPFMLLIVIFSYFEGYLNNYNNDISDLNRYELNSVAISKKTLYFLEIMTLIIDFGGYFLRNFDRIRWFTGTFNPVFYGSIFSEKNKGRFIFTKLLIIFLLVYMFIFSYDSKLTPFTFYWEV